MTSSNLPFHWFISCFWGQNSLTVNIFVCCFFLKLWIFWRTCQYRGYQGSACVAQYEVLSDTNVSGGDVKRMGKQAESPPVPWLRKISFLMFRKMFAFKMTQYKGFQSVFEFHWWPSLAEEKLTLTRVKFAPIGGEKWHIGKRIREEGPWIVLGITHSDREDCSHLLMDCKLEALLLGVLLW